MLRLRLIGPIEAGIQLRVMNMVKTVEKSASQTDTVKSIEPSGLWSTDVPTAFQQLLRLQTEISERSFRDGMARLLPTTALNSAVDKILESVVQYPGRMEQATKQLCASFDLLAKAQVDWFSRACDNWVEINRSASASVFRSTATEGLTERRISARMISFPDRRSPVGTVGTAEDAADVGEAGALRAAHRRG